MGIVNVNMEWLKSEHAMPVSVLKYKGFGRSEKMLTDSPYCNRIKNCTLFSTGRQPTFYLHFIKEYCVEKESIFIAAFP